MSDAISRQAAIDALNEYFSRIGKLKRRGLNKGEKAISLDTVGAINSLPYAQPEPHWIPVTERLPESKEEDLEYPTVIIDLDGQVALGCYYESTREWGMGEYFNQKCFPIAWMPLPEPYKG